ncbi:MAG TPA: ISAzo13 family transposase, partial [Methanosarcinaceae archaeon]|nr:ISAzo13 family transposase [Methanosarcinaceae archaeon]
MVCKMKISEIAEDIKSIIKSAANKMSAANRREYIGEVTIKLLDSNARKAESEFGWGRETVKTGMAELITCIRCLNNFSARGNKKTEEKMPELVDDIRSIVNPKSQADPKFQTPFLYTRITAKTVRQTLIDEKGYTNDELPCENTMGNILKRMGYNLKRIQKTKPLKKIPETDEIFKNVDAINRYVDDNPDVLRISIDTKAKVNVGEFSRGGKTREKEPEGALDHDMDPDLKMVPFGIFEPSNDHISIVFGTSNETTDFIADSLELWWEENKKRHSHIKELVINLDNGPHINSHRTQFIKRIIEFADKTGLKIRLVYYPPYHSKYNPIERCWGVLEMHWNGTLLSSIYKVIGWAETMTWNGVYPVVHLVDKVYQKGVKLTKEAMKICE